MELNWKHINCWSTMLKHFDGVSTVQGLPMMRQKEMVCPGMSCFLKPGTVCAMHSVHILLWEEQVEETLAGPGPCSFKYP